jgi:hypothetical protein
MHRLRACAFVGFMAVALAAPVHADAILSFGPTISTQTRPTVAVSVGTFIEHSFLGWELEIVDTRGNTKPGRLSMGTIGASFLVQSPVRRERLRVYGAVGFGVFGGDLPDGRASGEVSSKNFGGGLKLKLAGPLLMRVDYRLVRLGEAPDADPAFYEHTQFQRVLVGVGLAF